MKIRLFIALLPTLFLIQGCGIFCNAYTGNGTRNMDGYCANHWYVGAPATPQNYQQPVGQQQAPAYDWSSAPSTNYTGTFGGGGGNVQLQGLPNQNRPSCVSRVVNGAVQSCQ